MKTQKEPKYVQQTLEFVNRMRAALSMKPIAKLPKVNVRENHDGKFDVGEESCPIATALTNKSNDILVEGIDEFDGSSGMITITFPAPSYAKQFINNFDNGKLRQYAKVVK